MKDIEFYKADEHEGNYIFTSNSIEIYLDLIKLKAFVFDGEEFEVTNEEVDINKLLENKSFYYQLVCEFCNNTKGYDSSDNPCIERMEYCDCEGMNHELQEFYDSINK
jgi:hypothetical protein